MGMHYVTNGVKINGASLILWGNIMQKIRKVVGGDFYIRPSSCREFVVVLKTVDIELKELSTMRQQINWTEVSREDRLSDYVQCYGCKEAIIENTQKRTSRCKRKCRNRGYKEEHS